MNAIKKAILEGCKTADEVGKKLGEPVSEVHFDSAMANVKHERERAEKALASAKAAEGSKE